MTRNPNACPGTYALIFTCCRPFDVCAGKLGRVHVSDGYWIYVGSAFGPGGLGSRLRHHLNPSPRPHWHLDYIKSGLQAIDVWATTDTVRREHAWVARLADRQGASRPIAGFGATDCACLAHLIHMPRRPCFSGFRRTIRAVFRDHGPICRLGLADIASTTIITNC